MSPFPSPSPSPSPSPFTQSPCTPSPSPRRRYPLVQGHVGPISCAMGTSPGRSSGWRFSQHCPLRSPHAASPQCTHASQRGLARQLAASPRGVDAVGRVRAPPAGNHLAGELQVGLASTGRRRVDGKGSRRRRGWRRRNPRRRVARPPRRSTKRRETRARDAVDGFVVVPALDCLEGSAEDREGPYRRAPAPLGHVAAARGCRRAGGL